MTSLDASLDADAPATAVQVPELQFLAPEQGSTRDVRVLPVLVCVAGRSARIDGLLESLAAELSRAAAEVPLAIEVSGISPAPAETDAVFAARFERMLRLREPATRMQFTRLQAIIGDEAPELELRVRRWRPNCAVYRLDPSEQIPALAERVVADIALRLRTPLSDGLAAHAQLTRVSMHAMEGCGIDDGSHAGRAFEQFVGHRYLGLEATSTRLPLDSFFAPTGPIAESRRAVAQAFGAESVQFVTSGTSGANRILYSALVADGDWVILDRCCHISHHSAIASVGAHALLLDPEPGTVAGVPTQIPIATLRRMVTMLATAPGAPLPRVIALSNPTFDGHLARPADVIGAVTDALAELGMAERLREIHFLFDEAWFSFGYFHPDYVESSAMGAVGAMLEDPERGGFWRENLNVVATQSLHKTSIALRQASILLARTGSAARSLSGRSTEARLAAAVRTEMTTSPSLPILASIEWARRQLDLEGCFFVERAHVAAERFRHRYRHLAGTGAPVEIVAPTGNCDRTKVTLRARWLTGAQLRDRLWALESVRVQVNKFAHDSVLLMFRPGFSERSSAAIETAMDELLASLPRGDRPIPAPLALPLASTMAFVDREGRVTDAVTALRSGDGFRPRRGLSELARTREVRLRLDPTLPDRLLKNEPLACATFVTPYPPGFPVLLPSQLITPDIARYLLALVHGEVHGIERDACGDWLPAYRISEWQR